MTHDFVCEVCGHIVPLKLGTTQYAKTHMPCPSAVCWGEVRLFRRKYEPTPFIIKNGGTRGKT